MSKDMKADPSPLGDRINSFSSRVEEAALVNPSDRFFQGVLLDIGISKVTKSDDEEYWSKVIAEFEEYTLKSKKRVPTEESVGIKHSFTETVKKDSIPEFAVSKHWGDYSTSSEDEEMLESIRMLARGTKDSSVIRYPSDMGSIWPRGLRVLTEAAGRFGLTCLPDKDVSMEKNGFKEAAALSDDKEAVKEYIASRSSEQCTAIGTLMTLVYFLRIQPNEWLAKSNQYALTASYALHHLIKGDTEEDQELIKKSLKHSDGGKALIGVRIGSMFSTGSSAPMLILNSVDRLYRLIAKNYEVRDKDEFQLVLDTCFTSKTGIVRSFYRNETRREVKSIEEVKPSGRKVTVRKDVLVKGLQAPKLHIGSEFLKEDEISRLRSYEKSFPNEVSILTDQLKRVETHDFLLPAKISRIIVEKAYAISDRISKTLKRRKEETRILALTKTTEKKITQLAWVGERNSVLRTTSPLDESIYEDIERFCIDVSKAVDALYER